MKFVVLQIILELIKGLAALLKWINQQKEYDRDKERQKRLEAAVDRDVDTLAADVDRLRQEYKVRRR